MKVCAIGVGVIGAGWVARFILNGVDVAVFDLAADHEKKVQEIITLASKSLPHLYDRMLPNRGTLSFHSNLKEAVQDADWIQESLPENLELKRKVLQEVVQAKKDDAIIASSTSGFKPSALQENLTARDGSAAEIVIAHPFNPVYLLPLVEIVIANNSEKDALYKRIESILHSVGMTPLRVRAEIDGHIADRLLEAVWRESLWLVHDGIATTKEIDDAICMGFGLRWAQMGLFETYRIGGGEKGMRHFIEQFGPALKWPWTKLMDTPELDDELVNKIADQSDAQSGHMTIKELEALRDRNLVGIMRSLRASKSGVGGEITTYEESLPKIRTKGDKTITASLYVPGSWMDSNGHMNEVYYLQISNRATVSFLESVGADDAYIRSGGSYFAVETKQQYKKEIHQGCLCGSGDRGNRAIGQKAWLIPSYKKRRWGALLRRRNASLAYGHDTTQKCRASRMVKGKAKRLL